MAAQDLTTLADVRAFLQRDTGAETGQDPIINSLITRVSDAFRHEIAWFLPAEAAATKTFVWRGGPLGLHPYFARTVTAVTLDSDTTSTTSVASTDWRLRPKPAVDGVYRWLTLPTNVVPAGVEREVTVTGNWGFADQSSIPTDVQHWAIVTVATWLRRDVSAFSTTFRLDDERLERPEALPVAVVRALAHYRTPKGI